MATYYFLKNCFTPFSVSTRYLRTSYFCEYMYIEYLCVHTITFTVTTITFTITDLTLDLPILHYIYQYYTTFTDRHTTTRISDRRNKTSESRSRKKNLAKTYMLTKKKLIQWENILKKKLIQFRINEEPVKIENASLSWYAQSFWQTICDAS